MKKNFMATIFGILASAAIVMALVGPITADAASREPDRSTATYVKTHKHWVDTQNSDGSHYYTVTITKTRKYPDGSKWQQVVVKEYKYNASGKKELINRTENNKCLKSANGETTKKDTTAETKKQTEETKPAKKPETSTSKVKNPISIADIDKFGLGATQTRALKWAVNSGAKLDLESLDKAPTKGQFIQNLYELYGSKVGAKRNDAMNWAVANGIVCNDTDASKKATPDWQTKVLVNLAKAIDGRGIDWDNPGTDKTTLGSIIRIYNLASVDWANYDPTKSNFSKAIDL